MTAEADAAKADQAAKAQQEAAKKHAEETKKKLAEERTAREKASKEAPAQVKPTPTQEENDLAASGVHVAEHEPDGSPEETTHLQTLKERQAETKPVAKGSYQNRAASTQT